MSPTQAKLPEDFSVRSLPQTSTYTQWFPNSSSIPPELQERENDALEAQTWVWSFLESYSLSSCPSAFGSEVAQVVSREMEGRGRSTTKERDRLSRVGEGKLAEAGKGQGRAGGAQQSVSCL